MKVECKNCKTLISESDAIKMTDYAYIDMWHCRINYQHSHSYRNHYDNKQSYTQICQECYDKKDWGKK